MNKVTVTKGDKTLKINDNGDAVAVMQAHGWSVVSGKSVKEVEDVADENTVDETVDEEAPTPRRASRRRRA